MDIISCIAIVVVPILTLIVAIKALRVAWCIPKQILLHQIYADLVAEYRKPEMGAAIIALFDFYKYYDSRELDIGEAYITLYNKQIKQPLRKNLRKNLSKKFYKSNRTDEHPDFSHTLHLQRRLVAQFYTSMAELCLGRTKLLGRIKLPDEKIKEWFTPRELTLLKLILYLHRPAEYVFTDIDVPEPQKPNDVPPMNNSLYDLYNLVKDIHTKDKQTGKK